MQSFEIEFALQQSEEGCHDTTSEVVRNSNNSLLAGASRLFKRALRGDPRDRSPDMVTNRNALL